MNKTTVAVILCSLWCCTVHSAEWKKDDFIKLWNQVRTSIQNGDYASFQKLQAPAKEPKRQLTKEQFSQAKEFLLTTYPDLSTINFLKFEQDKAEALFVLQTYLDDKTYITLDAYKFIKQDNLWKVSGQVGGISFAKSSPDADKKAIEKELTTNPKFTIGS